MSWHDRLFRTLPRVLPAEFRGDYEREMAATFRAQRRGTDGAASLARVWLATVVDVCRTAPAEPGMTGYLTFADLRDANQTLESAAALAGWSATLTGDGQDAERIPGVRVTWEYVRTVGLTPALGRDFEHVEDHPQRNREVIRSLA